MKLPDDYEHDLKRGTVAFDPTIRNYSFNSILIPDGAVVTGCNFTQNEPGTSAIRGKDITFIECNLVNNALDDSWVLKDCNTAQAWLVSDPVKGERRSYICAHPKELRDERAPVNAILTRTR